MAEIRFPLTDKLHAKIIKVCEEMGITKSDYIKNLIINDLTKRGGKKE
jgi:hypothetical protein